MYNEVNVVFMPANTASVLQPMDQGKTDQISRLTRVYKEVISILMYDFKGFKTSVEEVTADVKIARELELVVEPEDVTELLQSHDKIFIDESRRGEEALRGDRAGSRRSHLLTAPSDRGRHQALAVAVSAVVRSWWCRAGSRCECPVGLRHKESPVSSGLEAAPWVLQRGQGSHFKAACLKEPRKAWR
ncbi:hypothetical protein QTO34_014306 [Cnephaeus nilssonii]|uniref:DDE-1 domain-containing protein n=1 Tax=Cnephaeus nilssonii TaxID=3371016 RepID=A0AA40LTW2_CNENI|nr:hypothetical protein QTO34_014306 [Eptesicus nilssonii]